MYMKIFITSLLLYFISYLSYSQKIEILYKIDIERQFSKQALLNFKKRQNQEMAKNEILAFQNPNDEYYSLKINNNILKLDYIEVLDNDDKETHIVVKNYPLGKESFRKQNDSLIYHLFKFDKDKYYASDTLVKNNWIETNKDSVIMDYNVKQIKLKTNLGNYTAWFTNKLPQGLGIGSLSYEKGFILAYSFSYLPREPFIKYTTKVYPYKKKKLRKKKIFDFKIPDKLYTQNEIKEIFRKRNEILNKPTEIKN
mgnify:CR=1 FL=1